MPRSDPDPTPLPSGTPPRGLTPEVTLMGLLAAFLLAAISSMLHMASVLHRSDDELELAGAALETLRQEVLASCESAREAPAGWSSAVVDTFAPGGVGAAVRAVEGLTPWEGARGVCSVEVITDETLSDRELDLCLGLPRDLDDDWIVANADVRENARLLPLLLRARWHGAAGEREIVQPLYVEGY